MMVAEEQEENANEEKIDEQSDNLALGAHSVGASPGTSPGIEIQKKQSQQLWRKDSVIGDGRKKYERGHKGDKERADQEQEIKMILQADALNMPLQNCSVDAIVTDPPYGLEFMGKEWDKLWDKRQPEEHPNQHINSDNPNVRGKKLNPVMGLLNNPNYKAGIEAQLWHIQWLTEAYRVLKPGGHLIAMGGDRTHHRLMCAVEDVGFQIRTTIAWIYGQGFPKSYNISKNLNKLLPVSLRCVCGQNDSEKPLNSQGDYHPEYDLCDEKLLSGRDSDPTSFPIQDDVHEHNHVCHSKDGQDKELKYNLCQFYIDPLSSGDFSRLLGLLSKGCQSDGNGRFGILKNKLNALYQGNHKKALRKSYKSDLVSCLASFFPYSSNGSGTSIYHKCDRCQGLYANLGLGTALKPAMEPICVAMKPIEKNYIENVLKWGVGAVNVDECRIGLNKYDHEEYIPHRIGCKNGINHIQKSKADGMYTKAFDHQVIKPSGRFPANIILSHHPECVQVGMKRVKSEAHHTHKRHGKITYSGKLRDGENYGNPYTNSDGLETVESWQCHPDCPVKMMDEQNGNRPGCKSPSKATPSSKFRPNQGYYMPQGQIYSDNGGPSRFFYCAKASRSERNAGLSDLMINGQRQEGAEEKRGPVISERCINCGKGRMDGRRNGSCCDNPKYESIPPRGNVTNHHPTVKPIALFEWLIKLVAREGQTVLDPFLGSGTTAISAHNTGRKCIGIEREAEYVEIASRRKLYWQGQPKQMEL